MLLNSLKYFFVITALTVFSGNVMAGANSSKSLIEKVTVNQTYLKIYLANASAIKNPNGCNKTAMLILSLSDDKSHRGQRHYSALMTALTAGKPVQFWISGCYQVGSDASDNYPEVQSVTVYAN